LEKELFMAVENNDKLLVEQLIEKEGANPNGRLPEYQGRTPLHLAAQFGHVRFA
jgi:ankyrin repeat protein